MFNMVYDFKRESVNTIWLYSIVWAKLGFVSNICACTTIIRICSITIIEYFTSLPFSCVDLITSDVLTFHSRKDS